MDARLLRHLVPLNGTPQFMKNDMIHDVLKRDFQQRLQDVSCQALDFSKRPSSCIRRPGGCVYTSKGYHRSPGKYLIAKAFAECISAMTSAQCLAAHIRCGAMTHEDAAKISGATSEEILLAVEDLAQLQKEVSATKKFKHEWCSGCDALAGKPSPRTWLHVDFKWLEPAVAAQASAPTQEQLKELEICRTATANLKKLRARTLFELVAPQEGPLPDILMPDHSSGASLVKLAAKPGPCNADQSEYFRQAAAVIFKNEQKFKSKRQLVDQAFDFQLYQLQQAWRENRLAGAMKKTRATFCWDALREANRCSHKSTLLNNILGDYQKYGLNCSGRADRKQKAEPEAAASEVINLDEIPEAVAVPQPVMDADQLRKVSAWRENVLNAKRKAAAASDAGAKKKGR